MLRVAHLLIFCLPFFLPAVDIEKKSNLLVHFSILEYDKSIENTINTLFNDIIHPQDQLIIYSPVKAYSFSAKTLSKPKEELIAIVGNTLKKDIIMAGSEYKQLLVQMKDEVQTINRNLHDKQVLKQALMSYHQLLDNMNQIRKINQLVMEQIAGSFKGQTGDNHLILIYQTEYRPIPSKESLDQLRNIQELAFNAAEIFLTPTITTNLNGDQLAVLFNATLVKCHLIYLNPLIKPISGDLREQSEDMYGVFKQIAEKTGGRITSTSNGGSGLKEVLLPH